MFCVLVTMVENILKYCKNDMGKSVLVVAYSSSGAENLCNFHICHLTDQKNNSTSTCLELQKVYISQTASNAFCSIVNAWCRMKQNKNIFFKPY